MMGSLLQDELAIDSDNEFYQLAENAIETMSQTLTVSSNPSSRSHNHHSSPMDQSQLMNGIIKAAESNGTSNRLAEPKQKNNSSSSSSSGYSGSNYGSQSSGSNDSSSTELSNSPQQMSKSTYQGYSNGMVDVSVAANAVKNQGSPRGNGAAAKRPRLSPSSSQSTNQTSFQPMVNGYAPPKCEPTTMDCMVSTTKRNGYTSNSNSQHLDIKPVMASLNLGPSLNPPTTNMTNQGSNLLTPAYSPNPQHNQHQPSSPYPYQSADQRPSSSASASSTTHCYGGDAPSNGRNSYPVCCSNQYPQVYQQQTTVANPSYDCYPQYNQYTDYHLPSPSSTQTQLNDQQAEISGHMRSATTIGSGVQNPTNYYAPVSAPSISDPTSLPSNSQYAHFTPPSSQPRPIPHSSATPVAPPSYGPAATTAAKTQHHPPLSSSLSTGSGSGSSTSVSSSTYLNATKAPLYGPLPGGSSSYIPSPAVKINDLMPSSNSISVGQKSLDANQKGLQNTFHGIFSSSTPYPAFTGTQITQPEPQVNYLTAPMRVPARSYSSSDGRGGSLSTSPFSSNPSSTSSSSMLQSGGARKQAKSLSRSASRPVAPASTRPHDQLQGQMPTGSEAAIIAGAVSSTNPQDMKKAQFMKTLEFLKKTQLIGVTMKTAELVKKNQAIQKEIEKLREEVSRLVSELLVNGNSNDHGTINYNSVD